MSATVRFFNTFEPVTDLYRNLIPGVAAEGHDVTVYVSRAEYRPGRNLGEFLARVPRARIAWLANLGLHARHGTAAKAFIGAVYFVHALLRTLFARGRYRNVFLTQPPFIPLLGLILSRLRKQPYCVILMDLQPHLAEAVGMFRANSLSYRALYRVNLLALRNADRVIVIGRCMAETVRLEGIAERKIRVIPNLADPEKIRPVPHARNRLRREMGWGDSFVVMYAGTLGYAQRLDELLAAARILGSEASPRFVVIGEGVRRAQLEDRVAELGLCNIELHPFLHERFDLSEILSAADVHFIPLHADVTGLAVPSKTYSILTAGRPFIFQGSERCEIARLAREEPVGIVVPPRAPERLAEAIRGLAADPERARELGRRARALSEKLWSNARPTLGYQAVISELEEEAGRR